MEIISLFSGCGGLDLGFKQAGFDIKWHNEFDKHIAPTLKKNFNKARVDTRDIREIQPKEIPDCLGIIGGPPCQSWSEIGNRGGIQDERGQLFLEYVKVIKDKKPLFFLAENVGGMLYKNMKDSFVNIVKSFERIGYNVEYKLINSKDYGVPQERKRVFIIGYRKDKGKRFDFNKLKPAKTKKTLEDYIFDLRKNSEVYPKFNLKINSHEYYNGGFSSLFMSRNRRKKWDEQSFTIQANARHVPLHPDSCEMLRQENTSIRKFKNKNYRRLSVRECARIQTFPDDFVFIYKQINNGYKMVGNAVPILLSKKIAKIIQKDLI